MGKALRRYRDALLVSKVFEGLAEEDIIEVLKTTTAEIRTYAKGERLVSRGDIVRDVYIILRGEMNVSFINAEGEETVLYRFRRGTVFGAMLLFAGYREYPYDLYAERSCTILNMNMALLHTPEMLERYEPIVGRNLGHIIAGEALNVFKRCEIFGQKRIRSRVLLFLGKQPRTGNVVYLQTTRTALATYLGVDRSSLTRELAKMHKEGLIRVDRDKIELLDEYFFQPSGRRAPAGMEAGPGLEEAVR